MKSRKTYPKSMQRSRKTPVRSRLATAIEFLESRYMLSNGLIGQYFSNTTLTGTPVLTRTDSAPDFSYGNTAPGTGVPADAFSVRWLGQITPTSTSTTWQLGIYTDGGVRLYFNNQLVINDWSIPSGGAQSYYSADLTLTAGTEYNYRLEYFSTTASTTDIYAGWQTNTSNLALVPTANFSTAYIDTTAPSVPTGLAASNTTQTATTLNWTASTDDVGVAGYDILRNGTKVGTSTTTSYTDTGLTPSTAYSYTVEAYDAAGNVSAASTALPVTTLASTDTQPPTAPTGLTLTGSTDTSLSFSWTASTDNVGVTGYAIYRNGAKVGSTTTALTYTDTGLTPNTTYSYTVTASDAAGNVSQASSPLQVSTLADTTPPSIPQGLAVTSTTASTVSLSWSPSTDDVGVAGYDILRNGSKVATSNTTTYTDSGLSVSTGYSYTVEAYDAAGNTSSPSSSVTGTTKSGSDTTPPSIPTGLAVAGVTTTTASIYWTPSTDNVGVALYEIYRNGTKVGTSTTNTYTDTGLVAGTSYSYTVAAADAAGNTSAASVALPVTTAAAVAVTNALVGQYFSNTTLTGPATLTRSDSTIGFDWGTASPGGSVPADAFSVRWTGQITPTSTSTTWQLGIWTDGGVRVYLNNQLVINDWSIPTGGAQSYFSSALTLTAGVKYNYRVEYFSTTSSTTDIYFGWQTTSSNLTVIPTANIFTSYVDTTAPTVPTGLAASGTTSGGTTLSWTASTDDVGVTSYDIFRNGVEVGTSTTTSFTDSGLSPSTSYSYTVDARDAAGNVSAPSTALPVTTLAGSDTQPPTAPTGLTLTGSTDTSLSFSWTASTDNVGVTGYAIYRNGAKVGSTTTALTYTDTGLTPNTTYSYTVTASDAAGNVSAPSTALPVTTLAGSDTQPPTAPTGLTLTGSTDTSLSFSWTASTDNVGVTGYTIYRNGAKVGSTTTALTYTDTGLTPNTGYSYTVIASDAAGNVSSPSTALPITTTADTTPPSVPQGLAVTSTTTTSVSLSWSASIDDIGVTGYDIYRNGTQVGTSTTTSYTDTGLTASTPYSYTVKAYDAAGNLSAASSAVIGTTLATATNGLVGQYYSDPALTTLATTRTDPNVDFEWGTGSPAPSVPSQNFSVRWLGQISPTTSGTYTFAIWTEGGVRLYINNQLVINDWYFVNAPNTYESAGIALTAGQKYNFRLEFCHSALNADVIVEWQTSKTSLAVIPTANFYTSYIDVTSPTAPTFLTASQVTPSALTLSWAPATDDVAVVSYDVYRNGTKLGSTSGLSWQDSSLAAGTDYTYTVDARDAAGNVSVASSPLVVTTAAPPNDTQAPTTPTGLQVTASAATSISLSWSASTDNVAVSGYNIYRNNVLVGSSTTTSYTDTGLTFATSYQYAVTAVDASGNASAPTSSLTGTTASAVNGLVGQYYSDGSLTGPVVLTRVDSAINFMWGSGSPAPSIGAVDYSIRWTGQVLAPTTGSYTFVTWAGDGTRVYINNQLLLNNWKAQDPAVDVDGTPITLTAGTKYNIRVEYFSAEGVGDVIVGWIPPKGSLNPIPTADLFTSYSNSYAPTVPTYPATPVVTSNSVLISWAASTDDLAVAGYYVYRNGVLVANTTGTSALDTGLLASTSYSYTVSAYDAVGNVSAASTPITATTAATGATPSIIQAETGLPAGATISGGVVTSLDTGDYLELPGVNLGNNAQTLQAYVTVPLAAAGSTIAVHLDSPTGTLVGTLTLQATGPNTSNPYVLQTASLAGASGVHNVYLVVTSGLAVGSIDWVRFDQNKQINIMPLGDSITQGPDGNDDYRYFLYKELQAAGYDVNFVGSQTAAFDETGTTNPLNFDFDQNNEGHASWSTGQVAAAVAAWAQADQPNIVLIHLGTNDIVSNNPESPATVTAYYAQIISALRAVNPNVTILLAQIIPNVYDDSNINALNAAIPAFVAQQNTAASPVITVNQNSGFNASTMLLDGKHPNEAGAMEMAAVWFAALQQVLP